MPWEAWVTLLIVSAMFYALWRKAAGADVILLASGVSLCALSVISPKFPSASQLAAQAGNEGVLTVAALFVVAAGLTETGGMSRLTERLLGRPGSEIGAQLRLMLPVSTFSAFLNNTPIVAMFMPVVEDWCRKIGVSPSKLLLPLSYAAILGGGCTLIGTSTNLVVQALLVDARRTDPSVPLMTMLSLTPIGVPVALAGIAYVVVAARWLLPDRRTLRNDLADARQYTIEMMVLPGSRIDGQTIEQAALRHLPGVFLSGIERQGEAVPAVAPTHVLRGNDRLLFVGVVESVAYLQRIEGLIPATDQVFKLTAPRFNRLLIEVVVSDTCPLVGLTIRAGQFRTRYDAAVIAVYRNGERMGGKIGDIVIRPGDTLLLQSHPDFVARHRNNRDFLLVAPIENTQPVRHERAGVAFTIVAAMVLVASLEPVLGVSLFTAALLAAAAMGFTGCLSAEQARRSLNLPVVISIVAALLIGRAVEQTGLAGATATAMMSGLRGFGPWAVLAGVYAMTLLFTELITNNAAAALAFPIARAAASAMDVSFMPFIIVVAIAASAGFATPLGYQTHLMVYGPGGYRFADFFRMGLPLDLLCMIAAVGLTPFVYPF